MFELFCSLQLSNSKFCATRNLLKTKAQHEAQDLGTGETMRILGNLVILVIRLGATIFSTLLQKRPTALRFVHNPRKVLHGAFFLLVDPFMPADTVRDNTRELVISISVAGFTIRNPIKFTAVLRETLARLISLLAPLPYCY